jgi:hypothetical protein
MSTTDVPGATESGPPGSSARRTRLIWGALVLSLVMIGAGIGIGAAIWSGGSTTAPVASNSAPLNATSNYPPPNLSSGSYYRSVDIDLVAPAGTQMWSWYGGAQPNGCANDVSMNPNKSTIGQGTTHVVVRFEVDNSFHFPDGGCAFSATTVEFGGVVDRVNGPVGAGWGASWSKPAGGSVRLSCAEHQLVQGTAKCQVVSTDKIVFTWSSDARRLEVGGQ